MRSSISKTRELLVDVARQLFAKMGIHNTTMNDIANASKRGRRTLYTYFKNKDDIYKAVVQQELKKIYGQLENVMNTTLSPDEKLIAFIYTRLDAIKEAVSRNGSLKAEFFRDIWRVQKERKKFDELELKMIEQILQEGVDKNCFSMPNVQITAAILQQAFKGLEVPYIRNIIGTDIETRKANIKNILFNGLMTNKK